MKKRTWVVGVFVLVAALVVGLGACGGEEADVTSGVPEVSSGSAVSDDEIGSSEMDVTIGRTVSCWTTIEFYNGGFIYVWKCRMSDGTVCTYNYYTRQLLYCI